jgi:hypothetical protein
MGQTKASQHLRLIELAKRRKLAEGAVLGSPRHERNRTARVERAPSPDSGLAATNNEFVVTALQGAVRHVDIASGLLASVARAEGTDTREIGDPNGSAPSLTRNGRARSLLKTLKDAVHELDKHVADTEARL